MSYSVTIIGFVGADPEQRQARNNNGSKFTVLSVATQRSWKNKVSISPLIDSLASIDPQKTRRPFASFQVLTVWSTQCPSTSNPALRITITTSISKSGDIRPPLISETRPSRTGLSASRRQSSLRDTQEFTKNGGSLSTASAMPRIGCL